MLTMAKSKLPAQYLDLPEEDLLSRIADIRSRKDLSVTILAHHYESDAIVRQADFIGDSFKLSRDASTASGRHIIFCGVRFMAESARVLARPDQIVQHAEPSAGCPMADMATLDQVEQAWAALTQLRPGEKIIPITYMNSSVDIKAFCGRHGGVVCTSSNAPRVFDWAMSEASIIMFFPDEHLGRNTANKKGFQPEDISVWNPAVDASQSESHKNSRIIVWKGFCHVHTFFTLQHIQSARAKYPGAHITVHPECPQEVVNACDSAASTEGIIQRVAQAREGETIVIGTEINLISRLADQFPRVNVVPLATILLPQHGQGHPAPPSLESRESRSGQHGGSRSPNRPRSAYCSPAHARSAVSHSYCLGFFFFFINART